MHAADVFLIVASVAIVIMTIMMGVLVFVAIRAVLEIRALVWKARVEAERIVDWHRWVGKHALFFGKWFRIAGKRFISSIKDDVYE